MAGFFTIHKDEERQILRRLKKGDSAASRVLYEMYAPYLAAVCSRYVHQEDVKDVLQESFITIFDGIDSFEYRGEGSLRAWMTRIVVNLSLKHLRQNSRIVFVDIDDTEHIDEPETEGIPPDVILRLIQQLPDGYRTIFNLYVIEGRSHSEIADELGIKESTSASQLHRAKALLARMINDYQNKER